MKNFLLVLLLCASINVFSQTENDSVLISKTELNEVFNAIDTLVYQDSLNTILIKDLKIQISNYQLLGNQDSLLLMYNNRQIDFLNQEIKLYDDRLKVVDKWYKKPWVGFIIGVATVTTSSWIVKNVVD
jgi:hypothetical protein